MPAARAARHHDVKQQSGVAADDRQDARNFRDDPVPPSAGQGAARAHHRPAETAEPPKASPVRRPDTFPRKAPRPASSQHTERDQCHSGLSGLDQTTHHGSGRFRGAGSTAGSTKLVHASLPAVGAARNPVPDGNDPWGSARPNADDTLWPRCGRRPRPRMTPEADPHVLFPRLSASPKPCPSRAASPRCRAGSTPTSRTRWAKRFPSRRGRHCSNPLPLWCLTIRSCSHRCMRIWSGSRSPGFRCWFSSR